jgi:TolA-binding protein/uncharacterized membrane-anchored protein YhcB (DUF1043 family)
MRKTLLALAVCSGLSGVARADDVDSLGGKVTELDARVYELSTQLKPPAEPGPEIADRRLIDAQVLYELKNYEAASIILFDVVDKYPNSPAYPEALFYLADSLYLKRDFLSSRRYFEKIVERGPTDRRYQESLQRLIELSLHTGDYSPVDGYIAKLEGLSVEKQSPSVPYVKGKYFYFRKQYDRALEALKAIGPEHKYYFHAQYFIGAANVAMGDKLDDALGAFGTVTKNVPKSDAQKLITELSWMAMARIYLERGQLLQARDAYTKVPQKSSLFNDMLYESAWVHIKGKDYPSARRNLDLLLLNAPESSYAPEVKLLVGSLHVRQAEYGPATDAFTKTRDEFEPIYKTLSDELARVGGEPSHFRDLIAQHLDKFEIGFVMPENVARWVRDEAEVGRLTTLIGDENELKRSLDEADQIVKKLEKTLAGPGRVNVFPDLASARAKANDVSHELTEVKKQLAAREAQLLGPVGGSEKAQLDQLEAQRNQLEAELAQLPGKLASVKERQDKARAKLNELDKRASELNVDVTVMKQTVQAARKIYEEAMRARAKAGAAPLSVPEAPAPQPEPPSDDQLTYAQITENIGKDLDAIQGRAKDVHGKVDKLKDQVLDKPAESRAVLDQAAQEVDKLDGELQAVRRHILDAASNIGVDDSDMQRANQLRAAYEEVLKRQHELGAQVRARLSPDARAKAEQVESIEVRARGVEKKVADFNARIDEILDVKLKDIQSALVDEKAHVVAYRDVLAGYRNESAEVGGGVVAQNFKNVSGRFYNIVVRADVGIIDVAWALKDSATKEVNRLVAERKRELKLLDDEFREVLKEEQQ